MDFPNPSPVVHEGGGVGVEFLFGAFIALSFLHPSSSSSSSSTTPPASPGDWWPLSSGRRGSRSPRDLPETQGGKISRVDKNKTKHDYFVLLSLKRILASYFFGFILRPAGAKYSVGKLEKQRLRRFISIYIINTLSRVHTNKT